MVKTEIEAETIEKKRSISSKATAISTWEWLGRGKYNISSEIERYNSVTREDVMRVYKKYIKGKRPL